MLDIATSIVSYGTIKNHQLQNRPLQGDWMIDPKTGAAVTDPHKSAEALLLPMAGYKGAGLALMLGLLAGTLNGALFGRDCVDFNVEPGKVTNTGQFVVALDPASFQKLEHFKAEVDRHVRSLRNSQPLPGGDPCGCRASARPAPRRPFGNGLALPPELLVQLDKLAAELSIKPWCAKRANGIAADCAMSLANSIASSGTDKSHNAAFDGLYANHSSRRHRDDRPKLCALLPAIAILRRRKRNDR